MRGSHQRNASDLLDVGYMGSNSQGQFSGELCKPLCDAVQIFKDHNAYLSILLGTIQGVTPIINIYHVFVLVFFLLDLCLKAYLPIYTETCYIFQVQNSPENPPPWFNFLWNEK